ncbi:MAG TPA: hypothetical protein ENG87_05600 [Candidatus Pacearchaeota archaeon]|nr:hypothetical protein [Candidatus Pacearchaeota archaeon]HDZ60193.1 hypothetical protein [Candidatus Pacearchaeota archaeon]
MNKEKERKELVRNLFFDQKITEIFYTIFIIVGIVFITWGLGCIAQLYDVGVGKNVFLSGIFLLIFLSICGVFIYAIGNLIYITIRSWIDSNLEKAEEKADVILKEKYRRKKNAKN